MRITTIEEAVTLYKAHTAHEPSEPEIEALYHAYRADAKHYKGFAEWLMYHVA